jgi:phospholipase C
MDSRREFIKKAILLSGAAGLTSGLPHSIERAFAIDPQKGSTYLDAEHVVILMQENRSFDHCYGTLQGVRGFNDPRALTLPNKNPVWLQTNEKGQTFVPFRLNIKDTNATWMGSLPHGWTDQVDARNNGRYDQWLIAKKPGRKQYADMPLALGYYNREDIPFYYSLADAFTVCDQNFCSSLTGTTPNRLYLWTGTIRENAESQARVRNEELDYNVPASWKTFPERLEENGISWKIYQNELSVGVGFNGDQDEWLANFTDNPIEWFSQYHVKFHPAYQKFLPQKIEKLKQNIAANENKLQSMNIGDADYTHLQHELDRDKKELNISIQDQVNYAPEKYASISQFEKNLHVKAFTSNVNDSHYHELTTLRYDDNGAEREMKVPKGDVLHQFRMDVKSGNLPTVSWLVAPQNFSDHPGSPWYGAWYVSETIDILTQNPDVWRKTIFILCYDENDGYFDHVPPFVPPVPNKPQTGLTSNGIDTGDEHVTLEMDLKRKSLKDARESAIGLGYRVPLVIVSPWSRGGKVCSQIFDHTSILQFLEKFLSHKTGKKIVEPNISSWRRAVCGDLTSVFQPYNGEKIQMPDFMSREPFIESIHKAQFKAEPAAFKALSDEEIVGVRQNPKNTSAMPQQEAGMRASCALPYQLYVNGMVGPDKKSFQLKFSASKEIFGNNAAGAPFQVYSLGKNWETRSYAVAADDELEDKWSIEEYYHFQVYGPNGFFREFRGTPDEQFEVRAEYERNTNKKLSGNLLVNIVNNAGRPVSIQVKDNAYQQPSVTKRITTIANIPIDLRNSFGWYDLSVTIEGNDHFQVRLAGRVEAGRESKSDPAMA